MAGKKETVFEGRTLDDAVRMGLEALGLPRAEVMITVLEEGSGGFLGLGARPYRVRVMPRPGGPPREATGRRERDDREGRDRRGRRERGSARGERRGGPQRGSRGGERERVREGTGGERDRGRPGREPVRAEAPRRDDAGPERREPGPAPGERSAGGEGPGRRRRRRRGGRGRGEDRPMEAEVMGSGGIAVAEESAAAGAPSPEPRSPRERDESRATAPAIPTAELEVRATGATQDLLRAMGFEARVTARAEGSNVDVTAEVSENEELLTGRKGEVRQALQHLLNLTLNRGEAARYHLQLEINDFWRRREQELADLARSMADEVAAGGREVVTEYLNAQERRVIHVTLRDDPRVRTFAIGDGLIKKLAVAPAEAPEASRESD